MTRAQAQRETLGRFAWRTGPTDFSLRHCRAVAAAGFMTVLAGCSFSDDDQFWPSKTGGDAASAASPAATASQSRAPGQPLLGQGRFVAPASTGGQPTDSPAGREIVELRGDLARIQEQLRGEDSRLQDLRAAARQSAGGYRLQVEQIKLRLQSGAPAGDTALKAQWAQAQEQLDQIGEATLQLDQLLAETAALSLSADSLLESSRATVGLYGALEENRPQLAALETDAVKTNDVVDAMLNEMTRDAARLQDYYNNEQLQQITLANAIDQGRLPAGGLANEANGAATGTGDAAWLVGRLPPLVVIRFEDQDVTYDQALSAAVSEALQRRPNAVFDVVAVAPGLGSPSQVALASTESRRNAEEVLRSLTDIGLPSERLSVSTTSNPNAQVGEVHLYVR